MNIYFQFLTQNQTAEVAQTLRIIEALTGRQEIKGRIKVHAQGAISRSTFSGIGALADRMAKKRFNDLKLTGDAARLRLGGKGAKIRSLECTLSISPTCALWFPCRDWRTDGDRASDNRYMTAKSRERTLDFHHVRREPAVFELLAVVTTKLTQKAMLDESADLLAGTVRESFDKLRLFGCCDIIEPICIPEFKTSVVMPQIFQVMMKVKTPGYPELGDRFEGLHPLLFGSRRLCGGISDALGKEAKLTISSHAKDFAVVRVARTCDKESARSRAASWMISADKLT